MNSNKKPLIIIISVLGTILLFFAILYYEYSPRYKYELKTSAVKDGGETPLEIETNINSIKFKTRFNSGSGENHSSKLQTKFDFDTTAPFIHFSRELVVELINDDNKVENMIINYEISGEISLTTLFTG